VVAYQCLAGRRPFEGEQPLEIAMRHVREVPPPLPPDTPPTVRAIVERAMAKDPAARWPTASAFAAVARRAAAELAAAAPARPGGMPATAQVSGQPYRTSNPVTPTPTPTPTGTPVGVRTTNLPPGYPPGYPPQVPGYLQAPIPPKPRTSTGFVVAIILAVVLVAICVGAALAIVQQQQGKTAAGGHRDVPVSAVGVGTGKGD
jgi:serine/threonine-protein kinase